MKSLTKAEEEIMHYLWELGEASVSAIIELIPEPKPATNTVSTVIRILENKGFVTHRKEGRGYIYSPLVQREEYSNHSINTLVKKHFQGSFKSMMSFFVTKNNIDIKELEAILKEINQKED